ncbi:Serine/threonine-protein kinase CLA4 [Diplonema papillatum]|nr:Serine/threonine-protein kinase CLA4 [Diplonema papillatum]
MRRGRRRTSRQGQKLAVQDSIEDFFATSSGPADGELAGPWLLSHDLWDLDKTGLSWCAKWDLIGLILKEATLSDLTPNQLIVMLSRQLLLERPAAPLTAEEGRDVRKWMKACKRHPLDPAAPAPDGAVTPRVKRLVEHVRTVRTSWEGSPKRAAFEGYCKVFRIPLWAGAPLAAGELFMATDQVRVFRVKDRPGFVAKEMRIHAENRGRWIGRELYAVEVMREARHTSDHPLPGMQHLVEYYSYFFHQGEVTILMRDYEGGTLHEFLANQIASPADVYRRLRMISHFVKGRKALFKLQLSHRDFKPENLVFTSANRDTADLVIIDFGGVTTNKEPAATKYGTEGYMLNDVKEQPYYDGNDHDTHAFAVTVGKMLCNNDALSPYVVAEGLDGVYYDFISKCKNKELKPEALFETEFVKLCSFVEQRLDALTPAAGAVARCVRRLRGISPGLAHQNKMRAFAHCLEHEPHHAAQLRAHFPGLPADHSVPETRCEEQQQALAEQFDALVDALVLARLVNKSRKQKATALLLGGILQEASSCLSKP